MLDLIKDCLKEFIRQEPFYYLLLCVVIYSLLIASCNCILKSKQLRGKKQPPSEDNQSTKEVTEEEDGKLSIYKWYEIYPDRSIHSHTLFWIAISLPCFASLALSIPFLLEYELQLDYEGYKTFFEISKVPLGVLAFIVPLSLIVIRMHGSKQTAEQLRNQSRQLNKQEANDSFKHFLEHRSYIIDKLDNYKNDEECLVTFDSSELYNKIFPDLSPINFNFKLLTRSSIFLEDLMKNINEDSLWLLNQAQTFQKSYGQKWEHTYTNSDEDKLVRTKINFIFSYLSRIDYDLRFESGISIKSNVIAERNDGNYNQRRPVLTYPNINSGLSFSYRCSIKLIEKLNSICGLPILSSDFIDIESCDRWFDFDHEYKNIIENSINEYSKKQQEQRTKE